MLVAFAVYFIAVEEIHWRIHLEEWLPPRLAASRVHHLAHHACPNARFNIFLPLWDMCSDRWAIQREVHYQIRRCGPVLRQSYT
jgi:hypothetical protein